MFFINNGVTYLMKKQIKKYGNSLVINIDAETAYAYKLKKGDLVEIRINKVKK